MTTTDDILKEFREEFGFIAHKGVQCDEYTVEHIEQFIKEAISRVREETAKEIMTYGEKIVGYKCAQTDLFYKYARSIKANKSVGKDIDVPTNPDEKKCSCHCHSGCQLELHCGDWYPCEHCQKP